MHKHNVFSLKITSIQSQISYLRQRTQSNKQDDSNTLIAKNAYKGLFSETRKLLAELEKEENVISLYDAIEYQHRINKHLRHISNRNTLMHKHKRLILREVERQLARLIDNKKNEIKRTLDVLRVIINDNHSKISLRKIKFFKAYYNVISNLLWNDNNQAASNFKKLKRAIKYFVLFIRLEISPLLPTHNLEIDSSLNKLLFILQDNLQSDCIKLLNEIKHVLNQNKLLIPLLINHKELINITPANHVESFKFYNLIKDFIRDLEEFSQHPNDPASSEYLISLFNELQKKNKFYLDDKKFDNSSNPRFAYPQSIEAANAPSREGNEVKHFLNAYENIHAPSSEIQGTFPEIIRHIKNAKYIICITGWEINLHLDYLQPTLQYPEEHEQSLETLGKILVKKAIDNPSLVIAIKVWAQFFDSKMTYHHDSIAYLNSIAKAEGLKNGLADLPNLQFRAVNHINNFNTHHSKSVLVDAIQPLEDGSSSRKLTAFYGGLDLSYDRMDDSNHSFHRTPNAYGWRDVHQQVTGPVVADMLNDFASSWKNSNNGRLKFWNKWTGDDQNFCSFERFCNNVRNTHLLNYNHLATKALWNSQFLRSTTSYSHHSFWATPKPYERSIALGYKSAIEEAQHSIELETQYLIGGPGIHSDVETVDFNPIPHALVDKIIERHEAEHSFHVFITLPMLPNANSAPGELEMDSIRAAQWATIQWMMNTIEERTNKPWWNYISFNFLAQWYGQKEDYAQIASEPHSSRNQLIDAAQRSPVYVHSKFLTVDNNLMICGSANANERSMGGEKGDSEIAILNRPEQGYEMLCQQQIIAQRATMFRVTYGEDFLKKYPDSINHPEQYANQMRNKALNNFEKFWENTQGKDTLPNSSPLMTWPFIYSDEPGHVGEYAKNHLNLIDTPKGMETEGFARWHPSYTLPVLKALEQVDIRIAY